MAITFIVVFAGRKTKKPVGVKLSGFLCAASL
jgi:hypothetical protein